MPRQVAGGLVEADQGDQVDVDIHKWTETGIAIGRGQ